MAPSGAGDGRPSTAQARRRSLGHTPPHEPLSSRTEQPWAPARVSETSDWQMARLPSWPQYCRLTPTECRPCFTRAVPLLPAPQPPEERLEPPCEVLPPTVARNPLHRAPPPRTLSRQERLTDPEVAG